MKHSIRKAERLIAVLISVFMLGIIFSGAVMAEELDETVMRQLTLTGEGLTDTITTLSDESIAQYSNSSDDFTASAMDAWLGSREELGSLLTDAVEGEVKVSQRAGKYTVSVPRSFEKGKANFIYIFDRNLNPVSITIDVQLPMSTNLTRAALNTLMGILIVFFVLVFLSFVISLLKLVPGLVGIGGRKPEGKTAAPASAPAPVRAAAAEPVMEDETDDQELIAVIAAAIAAAEGTSPDGFVVRSIRKANRRR